LFASFVSDAHKVETHTRRRSTCGAKFLSDEEEAVSFTADCRETFTKHGTCRKIMNVFQMKKKISDRLSCR
jgi:hypothetical protein